jgi:hypothetical protein
MCAHIIRGNDFLKPLIIKEKSKLVGKENAERIKALLEQGDNIVILSNHQTEADPQVSTIFHCIKADHILSFEVCV